MSRLWCVSCCDALVKVGGGADYNKWLPGLLPETELFVLVEVGEAFALASQRRLGGGISAPRPAAHPPGSPSMSAPARRSRRAGRPAPRTRGRGRRLRRARAPPQPPSPRPRRATRNQNRRAPLVSAGRASTRAREA